MQCWENNYSYAALHRKCLTEQSVFLDKQIKALGECNVEVRGWTVDTLTDSGQLAVVKTMYVDASSHDLWYFLLCTLSHRKQPVKGC